MMIEEHPKDKQQSLFSQYKGSGGIEGRTLLFRKKATADGHSASLDWRRVSRVTHKMLSGADRGPDNASCLEAALWLEEQLQGSLPRSANDLETQANEGGEDFSSRTLRRARGLIGVKATKREEGWYWHLPGLEILRQPMGGRGAESE